ncbi:ATP-binding protein [Micromonospora sp. DT47]|uniref:ATP-binding protein n=1 Tax=Micromonospora sp. DT47 TaxID=3393431 RepID=UPI003CECA6BA
MAAAGLTGDTGYDFVLAVHELATNAVRHGGGHGHLDLHRQDDVLICEITDQGPAAGSLPVRLSAVDVAGGRGLWLAHEVDRRPRPHPPPQRRGRHRDRVPTADQRPGDLPATQRTPERRARRPRGRPPTMRSTPSRQHRVPVEHDRTFWCARDGPNSCADLDSRGRRGDRLGECVSDPAPNPGRRGQVKARKR